jgi:hypothetical protein
MLLWHTLHKQFNFLLKINTNYATAIVARQYKGAKYKPGYGSNTHYNRAADGLPWFGGFFGRKNGDVQWLGYYKAAAAE